MKRRIARAAGHEHAPSHKPTPAAAGAHTHAAHVARRAAPGTHTRYASHWQHAGRHSALSRAVRPPTQLKVQVPGRGPASGSPREGRGAAAREPLSPVSQLFLGLGDTAPGGAAHGRRRRPGCRHIHAAPLHEQRRAAAHARRPLRRPPRRPPSRHLRHTAPQGARHAGGRAPQNAAARRRPRPLPRARALPRRRVAHAGARASARAARIMECVRVHLKSAVASRRPCAAHLAPERLPTPFGPPPAARRSRWSALTRARA